MRHNGIEEWREDDGAHRKNDAAATEGKIQIPMMRRELEEAVCNRRRNKLKWFCFAD
jgi:hypothetical protein